MILQIQIYLWLQHKVKNRRTKKGVKNTRKNIEWKRLIKKKGKKK